ncbi:hypothetical protein Pcinc_021676 [Petrolisthes cinctipes]|uniref:Uncharacterized protein n=1 Tax=Petrolisthes cinctipes TaxID=88211 RepID=A0AAE1KEQ4_PETCI|nr:hypothetical protein Pcinc_021676 [Petrolisthes cinctipes]
MESDVGDEREGWKQNNLRRWFPTLDRDTNYIVGGWVSSVGSEVHIFDNSLTLLKPGGGLQCMCCQPYKGTETWTGCVECGQDQR